MKLGLASVIDAVLTLILLGGAWRLSDIGLHFLISAINEENSSSKHKMRGMHVILFLLLAVSAAQIKNVVLSYFR